MPGGCVPSEAVGSPTIPGGLSGAVIPGTGSAAAGGGASSSGSPGAPVLVPGCGAPGPSCPGDTPAAPPPGTPGEADVSDGIVVVDVSDAAERGPPTPA